MPNPVATNHEGKVNTLWTLQMQTDRSTPNNRLDITIHDNAKGTYIQIEVAVSRDRNVFKKEVEKILECMEIQRT
jgi:hypothetical protein